MYDNQYSKLAKRREAFEDGDFEGGDGDETNPPSQPPLRVSDALTAKVKSIMSRAILASRLRKMQMTQGYLSSVQQKESRRVEGKLTQLERNLFMSKQMYLMQERERRRLISDAGLVLWCALAVSVIFALLPSAATTPVLWYVIALVVLGFTAYVMFYLKQRGARRYDDWNKLYWKAAPDAATKGTEPDKSVAGGECPAS